MHYIHIIIKNQVKSGLFTKKYLIFFEHEINLSPDYGKTPLGYDIIIEKKNLFQGVPCTLVTETRREYRTIPTAADVSAEQQRLESALSEAISTGLVRGGITEAHFEHTSSAEAIAVTIRCECLEDIAVPGVYSPVRSTQAKNNER